MIGLEVQEIATQMLLEAYALSTDLATGRCVDGEKPEKTKGALAR